ncbi:hypothetical protein EDB87DRAFT_430532 [Lactarius vividus]|nr:hypothetical protein EDB87DRAFT_430532 [Lactarius vividus]
MTRQRRSNLQNETLALARQTRRGKRKPVTDSSTSRNWTDPDLIEHTALQQAGSVQQETRSAVTPSHDPHLPNLCGLKINCLVFNDHSVFEVRIKATDTISYFKNVIKHQNKNAFRHIDAKDLVLWQGSIPMDDVLKVELRKLELVDKSSSSVLRTLSEIFPEPPIERCIHIVVNLPVSHHPQKFQELTRLMNWQRVWLLLT